MRLINPADKMEHGCSLCQPCSKNCSKATRRHIGVIRVAHQGKTVEKHLQQNVCTMCLVHLGAGCFSGLPTLLKHRETLAVQPFAPEENCGNSTYPTLRQRLCLVAAAPQAANDTLWKKVSYHVLLQRQNGHPKKHHKIGLPRHLHLRELRMHSGCSCET